MRRSNAGAPVFIVFKPVVNTGEVKFACDDEVLGEFEGAGLDLFGKHCRDELTLGIGVRFVFCHCNSLSCAEVIWSYSFRLL